MKLYSYCLRYDGGAAPNPFWGVCTLVICKSKIRLAAEIGDWVVGLGSANSPIGNISTSVVYAMKVTSKLTMREYDQFCRTSLPKKIPQWQSKDFRLRMGDCVYQYGAGEHPVMRPAVHGQRERERDLSGKFALLSKHFYYFGDQPVPLPADLYPIIHATQGHKSKQNQPYAQRFVDWIEGLGYWTNTLYGHPQFTRTSSANEASKSACNPRSIQRKAFQRIAPSCGSTMRSPAQPRICKE
jgi:hypothetical protein